MNPNKLAFLALALGLSLGRFRRLRIEAYINDVGNEVIIRLRHRKCQILVDVRERHIGLIRPHANWNPEELRHDRLRVGTVVHDGVA